MEEIPAIDKIIIQEIESDLTKETIIALILVCYSEADAKIWHSMLNDYSIAWDIDEQGFFCVRIQVANGFYSIKTNTNINNYPPLKWIDRVTALTSAHPYETGLLISRPVFPLMQ
jgi:hypothetical protein